MGVILYIFAIWLVSTAVLAYPSPNSAENEETTDLIDVIHGNVNDNDNDNDKDNDNDNDNYQDFPVDTLEDFEESIPVGDFLSPANQNLDSNDEVLEYDLSRNKRHGGYGGYVVYPSYPIYYGGKILLFKK